MGVNFRQKIEDVLYEVRFWLTPIPLIPGRPKWKPPKIITPKTKDHHARPVQVLLALLWYLLSHIWRKSVKKREKKRQKRHLIGTRACTNSLNRQRRKLALTLTPTLKKKIEKDGIPTKAIKFLAGGEGVWGKLNRLIFFGTSHIWRLPLAVS